MNECRQVEIEGNQQDLSSLMKFLKEEGISFKEVEEDKESEILYEREIRSSDVVLKEIPYISVIAKVAGIVITKLTKEALKAFSKWLEERRRKGLKEPELEVRVEGNILKLNNRNMKILGEILREMAKSKKTTRKRKRKVT